MFDCVFILFSRQQWLYQVTSSDPSGTSEEMDGTLHILQDSMFSEKKIILMAKSRTDKNLLRDQNLSVLKKACGPQ